MVAPRKDIRPLLQEWEYENGNNVRRVPTGDGREVLQVRLPLGIEQYEMHGRPDGRRPAESESWFHVYRDRADESPWDFTLEDGEFEQLREECMLYYHRYLLFFQISEYKLCARDTQRNLRVLEFTQRYAEPKLSEKLEQYRPYIIRMNVMARALDRIQEDGEVSDALELLETGMEEIESLPDLENNAIFELEKTRSLRSLQDLHRQLESYLPKTRTDELEEDLARAVEQEDYERAARIRDALSRERES